MNERDVEAELRANLVARARRAPTGEGLAERIIDEALATRPVRDFHRPRGWRTWSLPLIAAGSVAAIVGALVGVSHVHHSAAPVAPGATHSVTPPAATPSPSPSAPSSPSSPTSVSTSLSPVGVNQFRVTDLSFVGSAGWGVGTADCLADPAKTCSALVHTTDGSSWHAVTGGHSTPFDVAAAGSTCSSSRCVEHIRFATASTGYAYGPSAFYLTTNGGVSWTHEAGGADALETLNSNVIRVTGTEASCGGTCPVVQTAGIGSTVWTTSAALTSWPSAVRRVVLSRTGSLSYLLAVPYNLAKGDPQQQAGRLYVSSDNGASWSARAAACPSIGIGYFDDAVGLTTANGESATVACESGGTAAPGFYAGSTVTSTDAGRTFPRQPQGGKLGPIEAVGSATASTIVAVASVKQCACAAGATSALWRSTDGGNTWGRIPGLSIRQGDVVFLGFESATDGRLVLDDGQGSTVWTTRNAGATWTSYQFP